MPVVRPSLWYDDVGFTQRYVPRTTTKTARSTLAPFQGPLSVVMGANLRAQSDATPVRESTSGKYLKIFLFLKVVQKKFSSLKKKKE